jgi:cellulose biosynthesis protein BcsQ
MDNLLNRRSRTEPGIVYTFYSYKGGVGRTMALANVGVLLALTGKAEQTRPRVLLVDWDLEAPGLDTYFELIEAKDKTSNYATTPGVVDLLEAQQKGESLSWRECLNRISFPDGVVDFISAGKKEGSLGLVPDYGTRVQRLDWSKLFKEHRIGNYWNQVRREWTEEYDYVLVDSRTGYTDIGDICTVLLADVLVLCFVTNYQNVHGINKVLKRARQARDVLPVDRSRLIAVPVGMRDEIYNERDLALKWRGIYAKELGYLFEEWLPVSVTPEEAINQLFVPYVPIVSFGERIPVLEHIRERLDPTSIGSAYVRLANLMRTRLDRKASFGGSAAQVAQKGLELGIERTESQKLRSEKEALEAQLKKSRRRMYIQVAAALIVVLSLGAQLVEAFRQRHIVERQIAAAEQSRFKAEQAGAEAATLRTQLVDLKVLLQRAQAAIRVLEVRGRAGSPIYKAAVTPGGQTFATLQGDGVTLWDAATGAKSQDFNTGLGNVSRTNASITTSPDGALLLAASFDNSALLWNVDRGEPLGRFRADGRVISAQFGPDGKKILTVSDDGARIWDAATGKVIVVFRSEAAPVASGAFSPDGTRVLTVDGKALHLWDAANAQRLWAFEIEAGGRGGPAFSPDGTRIVAPSGDKAQILDVATGRLLATLKADGIVNSARFSPDGRRIVLGSDDNTARIFDAVTSQQLIVMQGHTGAVISALFSPDGTRVLTASDDRSAHLWDATSGRSLQILPREAQLLRPNSFRMAFVS